MKEYGDKVPADKKAPIEAALGKLKEAHKNKDIAAIDAAMNELNTAWQAASQEMYAASQQAGGQDAGQQSQGQAGGNGNQAGSNDEVTDVDFEEVKDDDKK